MEQGLCQYKILERECLLKLSSYLIVVLAHSWKNASGDGKVELYAGRRALKPSRGKLVFYRRDFTEGCTFESGCRIDGHCANNSPAVL